MHVFAPLFVLLFFALVAHAQEQKRVAILNTEDNGEPSLEFTDLTYLTDRLREIAGNALPENKYFVMTTQSIIDKMGSKENARKVCKEAQCMAEIGRKISADYIGQARLGRFGGNLTISVELYHCARGNLIGSFTGNAKDVFGLLAVIDEKALPLFRKMPDVSGGPKASSPVVAGGISGVQSVGGDYEFDGGKSYLASISTEPDGAVVSFNGVPDSRCTKTPCKLELAEGNVRIIAALDQYERADTTVFIKQNNQSISIRLKSNFGVLEIKPAFLEGIGQNELWSLSINGKAASSWENKLSPGKYKVELSHRCYEVLSFEAGINKGSREIFDMSAHIKLKKGGLALSAERNGEPVSEPVFVNGKQAGETPFNGSVPVCAKVEIGNGKEVVDAKLKYNEKIKHTHRFNASKSSSTKPFIGRNALDSVRQYVIDSLNRSLDNSFIDSRDSKTYKVVKIGNQTWMAENLNYNASGSRCYGNQESNCQKYGRLYDWSKAKTACPKGWHLPSDADWNVLMKSVNPRCSDNKDCAGAGKKLKATSGWDKNGNGEDAFGFTALPGGHGNSDGSFKDVGYYGYWRSSSEYNSDLAYLRYMDYYNEYGYYSINDKWFLYSVRCLQD